VEVGADFDFDALVTECAALDALRQRFGRLDRLGELGESRATIIIREEQVGADDPDPVYGSALDKTWGWLTRQGDDVDFGIDHVQLPHESELTELLAPTVHAPVLLPSHLDSWIQTSPKPTPDPEVSLWLHGPERGSADVQIVWRADMTPDVLAGARHDNELLDELQRQLVACPPGTLEALSVPLGAVRAWLAGETAPELTDVVGGMESEIHTEGGRPAVCWRGDRSQIVVAAELSPGDTIVVPASYGGLRFGNWVPGDETVVRDLGDLVQWKQRGRPTVRLHPAVLEQWLPSDIVRSAPGVPPDDALDRVPTEEINTWLRALPSEVAPPMGEILAGIRPYRRIGQAGGWWTLLGRGRSARSVAPTDATGDDDASSFIEREVTLAGHCLRVQEAARASGLALCLPDPVVDDLALAGWLHDVGKADPRFQRMLVGGSEVRLALLAEPLAKSSMPERDLHSRRVAWERSNLPAGYRHELVSVSLLAACPDALCGAHDPDLVLFLIGGHHGWGRPFAPPVDDPSPVEVDLRHGVLHLKGTTDHRLARLDSGLAERFFDLVERYGWWGLAWLEAIFQLADHRVSEDEEVSR
jgi:CRISPR-associated endonuclease/helicase Cas3